MSNFEKGGLNNFVHKTTATQGQPQASGHMPTRAQMTRFLKVNPNAPTANSRVNRQGNAAYLSHEQAIHRGQGEDRFGTSYNESNDSGDTRILVEDSQVKAKGKTELFEADDRDIHQPNHDQQNNEDFDNDSEEASDEDDGEENRDPTTEGMRLQPGYQQAHLALAHSYPPTTEGHLTEFDTVEQFAAYENIEPQATYPAQQRMAHGNYESQAMSPAQQRMAPRPFSQRQRNNLGKPVVTMTQQDHQANRGNNQQQPMKQNKANQPRTQSDQRLPQYQVTSAPIAVGQTPAVRTYPVMQEPQHNNGVLGIQGNILQSQQDQQRAFAANNRQDTNRHSRSMPMDHHTEPADTGAPDGVVSPQSRLDYDPDELIKMNYEVLIEESYDKVPSPMNIKIEEATGLNQDEFHAPLKERLGLVQNRGPTSQAAFFASLSLAEWEEAGDWFLEQFSDLVKKMSTARKDKRLLAQQFEGRIDERHEAVAKRKRGIDDALGAMKNNGSQVLRASTPKRQKTPASTAAGL